MISTGIHLWQSVVAGTIENSVKPDDRRGSFWGENRIADTVASSQGEGSRVVQACA